MSYNDHHYLIDPARPRSEIWRTVLGSGLILGVYMGLLVGLFFVLESTFGIDFVVSLFDGATPAAMASLLATFLFMTFGVWCAMRLLHKRAFASLLGPQEWLVPQFGRAMVALIALTIVSLLIPTGDLMDDLSLNMPVGRWLMFLLPALVLVFIQISAEEFVFRGYLQSQLAARFNSPFVWMLIPSLLFGVLHHSPSEYGSNAIFITLWAVIFGALAADLTARSGTLGPALALHFANNVSAMLFVGVDGTLSGFALYTLPIDPSDPDLLPLIWIDLVAMFVAWLAVRVAIRR
ncbi:CPBP family intramembrane glutamic endopeptidase [Nereida sp. MMG025]|uniref:CPBP family intramembrane glutamic endopeptidase n=1 Tax=Nereida sp. MMG025 TaxID=2909981 RepID=UPI001F162E16|nr:type II CAAX endopeptidase family protein [Nereida sp. MMG025]MCF6444444.1 CPBP family intramembrane metalloprotease [Nereida sp. MMG025]